MFESKDPNWRLTNDIGRYQTSYILLSYDNLNNIFHSEMVMHIMIDLETMGKGSKAAIVAIGAVMFNESDLVEEFYQVVDLQSSLDLGLEIDASTVMWWMEQDKDAREELFRGKVTIHLALATFYAWCKQYGDIQGVWGNGATFDNVILSNAYKLNDRDVPWPYWADRCYRTIKASLPRVSINYEGTAHKAIDDAKWQALYLIKAMKEAGLKL